MAASQLLQKGRPTSMHMHVKQSWGLANGQFKLNMFASEGNKFKTHPSCLNTTITIFAWSKVAIFTSYMPNLIFFTWVLKIVVQSCGGECDGAVSSIHGYTYKAGVVYTCTNKQDVKSPVSVNRTLVYTVIPIHCRLHTIYIGSVQHAAGDLRQNLSQHPTDVTKIQKLEWERDSIWLTEHFWLVVFSFSL